MLFLKRGEVSYLKIKERKRVQMRKFTKKLLCTGLSAALLLQLAACGNDAEKTSQTAEQQHVQTEAGKDVQK